MNIPKSYYDVNSGMIYETESDMQVSSSFYLLTRGKSTLLSSKGKKVKNFRGSIKM